ncbi:MAG: prephenate dehydrogenase/arogenate dehydrogenase family protein [Thermodesulfobacteriota bacterium]
MEPRSIAVIGGNGRMGRLFVKLFREAGYPVEVGDRSADQARLQSLAQHDLVVLAVPISSMEHITQTLGPWTNPDGATIDIASVKEGPVRFMLSHCRGEVIGSHPLFGPRIETIEGQLVFICPGRSSKWISWYRSFLEAQGATVVDIEPDRHDRIMAVAQVLRHLVLFSLGGSLTRLEFDLNTELPLSGPWSCQLVGMLKHHLGQSPELYAELALHNTHVSRVVEAFRATANELCSSYTNKDRPAMVKEIGEIARYFEQRNSDGDNPIS